MNSSPAPVNDLLNHLYVAVLAAGQASRFGSSKQLAKFNDEPLVRRAVRLAEAVGGANSVLCVGSDWQAVYESASPLRGFLVMNSRYADGIASSIAAVVRGLPEDASALMLLLADQPLIRKEELQNLVRAWDGDPQRIVCSRFAGSKGPPSIFPAGYFRELAELSGDRGARSLINRHARNVVTVNIESAAKDIDTPGDLDRLQS